MRARGLNCPIRGRGSRHLRRLSRLAPLVDRDREQLAEIRRLEREPGRLLDEHGTTLRDESGIGTINAATLV